MHEIEYIAISKEEYDRLKAIEQSYLDLLNESKKKADRQIIMYRKQMDPSYIGNYPVMGELEDMNEQ